MEERGEEVGDVVNEDEMMVYTNDQGTVFTAEVL